MSEPSNVTKELLNVMLKLYNVRMNCQMQEKKNKGTTKCDENTIKYDVGTV